MGAAERPRRRLSFPHDYVGIALRLWVALRVSRGLRRRITDHPGQPIARTLAGATSQPELDQHRLFPPQRPDQFSLPGGHAGRSGLPGWISVAVAKSLSQEILCRKL